MAYCKPFQQDAAEWPTNMAFTMKADWWLNTCGLYRMLPFSNANQRDVTMSTNEGIKAKIRKAIVDEGGIRAAWVRLQRMDLPDDVRAALEGIRQAESDLMSKRSKSAVKKRIGDDVQLEIARLAKEGGSLSKMQAAMVAKFGDSAPSTATIQRYMVSQRDSADRAKAMQRLEIEESRKK